MKNDKKNTLKRLGMVERALTKAFNDSLQAHNEADTHRKEEIKVIYHKIKTTMDDLTALILIIENED